ncbi:MAG: hypothetical protein AAF449_16425 [Myxococcota bacterium]
MAQDEESKVGRPGFWAQARAQAKRMSDRVAANASDIAEAASAASQTLQGTPVFQKAREATGAARARIESAAADVQDMARDVGETAKTVITNLAAAPAELEDEGALVQRFSDALQPLSGQLDREANAIAIGYLGRSGIGVAEMTGTEMFYLRSDGPVRAQLRVSAMSGRAARLAAGASTGAYLACFYGPRDALSRPLHRRGGDVGVMIASIGFFKATAGGNRTAQGWMVGLSAGVGLGIPILSDLVAFELEDTPQGGFALDKSRSSSIEEMIASAPDRLRRRQLAQRL